VSPPRLLSLCSWSAWRYCGPWGISSFTIMGPPVSPVLSCGPSSDGLLKAWINDRLCCADPFLCQGESTASLGAWMPACQAVSSAFSLTSKDRQSRQPQGLGFEDLSKFLSTLTHTWPGCFPWLSGGLQSIRYLFTSCCYSSIWLFYKHWVSEWASTCRNGAGHWTQLNETALRLCIQRSWSFATETGA
jgi:hypothetical protein